MTILKQAKHITSSPTHCDPEDSIARITAVDRNQYLVRNDEGEMPAELSGRFAYDNESPADFPCVGDWVNVQFHDSGAYAIIHRLHPRKSYLRRKNPGKTAAFQMIAANIDVAFIVQSCHYDFNVRRLERYLVMVREGQIEPIILLTKTDLITPEALEQLIGKIHSAGIAARIIAISNVSGSGIEQICNSMLPGQTYCLLGSSGVGKTTLTNRLLGHSSLETRTVSGTGEGRHTTTRRQLMVLEHGAFLIDMPGMRELGMLDVGEGIDDSFADIQQHSQNCRFANCTHTNEPGCAVLRAIEQNELDAGHFGNYRKLKKESAFYEMSCFEKRQKDRVFGKHVRAVIKEKEKRNKH